MARKKQPNKPKFFTVFEHRFLRVGDPNEKGETFQEEDLNVLEEYYSENGVPYFSLGNKCVQFCEYVGVLQVGHLTIEVLPKADKDNDTTAWREKLVDMLRKVHRFEVATTSNSQLSLKSNSILEYYISVFLNEVQMLLHQGLVKRYRSKAANLPALKGRLLFNKHIDKNLIHKERFYVQHTVYDQENVFNKLLYKTLKLIEKIGKNSSINTKVSALLLDFPEMPDLSITDTTFDRLVLNRRTESYRTALSIARLLLLNYHPDIKKGCNNVVALMFDMNLLWERFVYVSLKKQLKDYVVKEQTRKPYWKLKGFRSVILKPDIKLSKGGKNYVLDTKWKVLSKLKPSHEDLRQMFAYTKYFSSEHTLLVYPGAETRPYPGFFHHEEDKSKKYPCSVFILGLDPKESISSWQRKIGEEISKYLEANSTP